MDPKLACATLVAALISAACGPANNQLARSPNPTSPDDGEGYGDTSSSDTNSAEKLSPVQMRCRSEYLAEIDRANGALGPNCRISTMPIAYAAFDWGAADGEAMATRATTMRAMNCICSSRSGCSEKVLAASNLRAVEEFEQQAQDKGVSEAIEKYERLNSDTNCVFSTVGGALYKLGFACGHSVWVHRPELADDVAAVFVQVFKPTDAERDKVLSEAAACFHTIAPTHSNAGEP